MVRQAMRGPYQSLPHTFPCRPFSCGAAGIFSPMRVAAAVVATLSSCGLWCGTRNGVLAAVVVAEAEVHSTSSRHLLNDRSQAGGKQQQQHHHCAEWSGAQCMWEPNLRSMTVDFGPSLQETFYAYVPPEVSSLYNRSASSDAAGGRAVATVPSRHRGLYAKFSNLSPNDLYVWTVVPESGQRTLAARIEPFGSYGTATHPGSKFAATLSADDSDSSVVVDWQVTEASGSNFHYDPFGGTQAARKALGDGSTGLALYQMQLKNLVFASQYRAFTGNEWLALYGQRMPPRFHMWRADAMGQTHAVETREIHFVENPDDSELRRGMSAYGPRPDQVGRMRRYRATHPTLNLTLTVLSGSPRVFEIQNFLSRVEVEHLLSLARGSGSSSFDPSQSTSPSDGSTTSQTWIERHRDFMVDAIYKRAADVLQMNEALLRIRRKSEIPEFVDSDIGVAERLQVVNYRVGQAEQPQYDFSVPNLVRLQPSRFATMVLYLNDDMEGGETTFPKWLNAESDEPLKIKPVLGKAILFYNMLPDGNYDERSLHASAPVVKGEKWQVSLWIWDPVLDHRVAEHY